MLQANSLCFSFSAHLELLSGIDLSLGSRAKVALAGPNGSGKSTLLRILAGRLSADRGSVSNAADILLLEQQLSPSEAPASGGEQRIEALREAFVSGARVLLLDEPTNDLDTDARQWLRERIRRSPAALLVVSHDPMILDLVDEIWELVQGKLRRHPPGYINFIERIGEEETRLKAEVGSLLSESRRAELNAKRVIESQQKRMIRGEKAGLRSNLPKIIRGARKRQAQATLGKAKEAQEARSGQTRSRLLEARARLRSISVFDWKSEVTRPPAGKRLLGIRDVVLPGSRQGLSFEMNGPRRIHLKGRNGSGKSTLLRALCGDAEARGRIPGELFLAEPFQLFDQSLSQFTSGDALWKWFQERTGLELSTARSVLGSLGLEQDEQLRPVTSLSGGERVRLEIALALHGREAPQLLLLDEPTNHLDLESQRILKDFVDRFEGGLVVVSHNAPFVNSLRFNEVIDLDGPVTSPESTGSP